MDVSKFNFPGALLDMITAISESHFVAIDLELSGVPVRPYNHASTSRGKPPLQARYLETKAAAERYAILQVGLTCVKEDRYDKQYTLRPWNIHISPLITERLDIDRDFSFHTGAVEFLNGVGFNFQAPLAIGVPYLSRREARLAKQRAEERIGAKGNFEPMILKDDEVESHAFMERVRVAVRKWEKENDSTANGEVEALYLGPRELILRVPLPLELTRFERRLVHQVIQGDFPAFMTTGGGSAGVQVMRIDQEREAKFRKQKMKYVNERIGRQTGFSWIIAAIAGHGLDELDWKYFAEQAGRQSATQENFEVKSDFQRAQSLLKDKPRPLVGHNMFLDLIYLYHHFIDDLPDTVEEFQRRLHEVFPIVIDTKYLATHECGDINPMSSLQQLAENLDRHEIPGIRLHEKHNKYNDNSIDHEAGFDSLLTAKVAIGLSTRLHDPKNESPSEVSRSADQGHKQSSDEEDGAGGVHLANGLDGASSDQIASALLARPAQANSTQTTSRFAHSTAFDGLDNDAEKDDDVSDEVLDFDALPNGDDNGSTSRTNGRASSGPLMPPWNAVFWKEYGNRLRVFGTQESLCNLDAGAELRKKFMSYLLGVSADDHDHNSFRGR